MPFSLVKVYVIVFVSWCLGNFFHCYDSFHNIFDLLAHTLDCFKNMDEIRLKLNDDNVS